MNSFLEITSNDNWFSKHPEKIAGVEYETTSFYFPIMLKGTKDDVLRVTGVSESNSDSNNNKKYDWDINFSSGPSKGKNLSELEFQSVEVYDDNIIAVEFWDGGIAQLNVSEVIGLLSITKNVVKIAVILDGLNIKSDQKIKRRLQSIANKSNRLIAVSNLGNRENRSFPFMFIHKDDLKNYTLSTEFQEKLITPRKALFKKIVADVNLDKEKRIRLAKAKAKALKVKLSLGKLGVSSKAAILKAIDELNQARSVKYWMEPEFKPETWDFPKTAKSNSFIKTTNSISDNVIAYDENGNIVGAIKMSNQGSEKGAFKIVVREDALRKGWGKKILDKAVFYKIDIVGNIKYNSFSASGRDLVRSWLKSKLKSK